MSAQVEDAGPTLTRARRLAWISIAYILSSIAVLFLVMSGSQALKTEFIGDAFSLIPPILFLGGDRISRKRPSRRYPFGYERAVSASYLGASITLLVVGLFLLIDAGLKLAKLEHPTIGGFHLFGAVVWTGWLAIAALLWSAIPAFFLGRAKNRIASHLHDKTLAADAETNKANWQSATAAIFGVTGIALGFWWLDACSAILISLEIIRSGISEIRAALGDLLDRRPQELLSKEENPLPERLSAFFKAEDWVKDAVVRVRERGRELNAEAHVVPHFPTIELRKLSEAQQRALELDERLISVVIVPVERMPPDIVHVRENT